MRGLIYFAGTLAAIGFAFGLVFSLFFEAEDVLQRVLIALLPATFTFVAVIILGLRDTGRHRKAIWEKRADLEKREDVSDDQFAAAIPGVEPSIALATRSTIASYFEVLPAKVYAEDQLSRDLNGDRLDIGFPIFIVVHTVEALVNPDTLLQTEFKVSVHEDASVAELAGTVAMLVRKIKCETGQSSGE